VLFKKLNMSGTRQKKNMCISLFKQFANKTECVAEHYCAVHQALVNPDADGDWRMHFWVFCPEDICGLGREDHYQSSGQPEVSEHRQERSWIWLVL
jgi:hypothetical protein